MTETRDLPILVSAAVTPEWMTAVLRKAGHEVTVAALTGKRAGTGQVGESVRFTLDYKGDAGGAPRTAEGGYPVSVVDWQSIGYGYCMVDVSCFLSGALPREVRREHEKELLTACHRRLGELGVKDCAFDEMMRHYALYSFSLFNMAFTASMIVEATERGDNMFFQMLRGGADHVLDTGALGLLPH